MSTIIHYVIECIRYVLLLVILFLECIIKVVITICCFPIVLITLLFYPLLVDTLYYKCLLDLWHFATVFKFNCKITQYIYEHWDFRKDSDF